jgi:flagellin-like protein
MKRSVKKKGLSPVIATVLLISIALILAVIIFMWARNFVSEKVQKFSEPVEDACEQISFDAQAHAGKIDIVNRGNVALYAVDVRKKSAGTIGVMQFEKSTIGEGETASLVFDSAPEDGVELLVVPIILGEANGYKKSYTCDEKYGIQVTYASEE